MKPYNVFVLVSGILFFIFYYPKHANAGLFGVISNTISRIGMEDPEPEESENIDLSQYNEGTLCYYKFHFILFYRAVNMQIIQKTNENNDMTEWECTQNLEYTPCQTSDYQQIDYATWRWIPYKFTTNFNILMENATTMMEEITALASQDNSEHGWTTFRKLYLFRLLRCLRKKILVKLGYGDFSKFDESSKTLLNEMGKEIQSFNEALGESVKFDEKYCESAVTQEDYNNYKIEEDKSQWYHFHQGPYWLRMLQKRPKDTDKQLKSEEQTLLQKINQALDNWRTVFNIIGSFEATALKLEDPDTPADEPYDGIFDRTFKFHMPREEWNKMQHDSIEDHYQWGAMFKNISYRGLTGALINRSEVKVVPIESLNEIPLPDGSGDEDYRRDLNYRIYLDFYLPCIEVVGEYYLFHGASLHPDRVEKISTPYKFRYKFKNTRFHVTLRLTEIDKRFAMLDRWQKEFVRFSDEIIFIPTYTTLTSDDDFKEEVFPKTSAQDETPAAAPEEHVSYSQNLGDDQPEDYAPEELTIDHGTMESVSSVQSPSKANQSRFDTIYAPNQISPSSFGAHPSDEDHQTRPIPEAPVQPAQVVQPKIVPSAPYTDWLDPPDDMRPFLNSLRIFKPRHDLIIEKLSSITDFIKEDPIDVSELLKITIINTIKTRIRSMTSILDLFHIFKSLIAYKPRSLHHHEPPRSFEEYFYDTVATKSSAFRYIEEALRLLRLTPYLTPADEEILQQLQQTAFQDNQSAVHQLKTAFNPNFEDRLRQRIKKVSEEIRHYDDYRRKRSQRQIALAEKEILAPRRAAEQAEALREERNSGTPQVKSPFIKKGNQ